MDYSQHEMLEYLNAGAASDHRQDNEGGYRGIKRKWAGLLATLLYSIIADGLVARQRKWLKGAQRFGTGVLDT